MPHGYPDWGPSAPIATVYSLQDMAELAVRLGSIVTFDRRGAVCWLDDFEHTINHWEIHIDSPPGAITLSAEAARTGALSAKITSPSINGDASEMVKRLPCPTPSNLGFEFSWAGAEDLAYLRAQIMLNPTGYRYYFDIRYDIAQDYLYYRNSAGTWVQLSPRVWTAKSPYVWNTIKFVIAATTFKWKHILFNSQPFDMANIPGYQPSIGHPYEMDARIAAYSGTAGSKLVYIDDVIITQNEP